MNVWQVAPSFYQTDLVALYHNRNTSVDTLFVRFAPTMVALGKASNAFLTWAASQGIETPLDLAERADGRYVTCSQDVRAGQDLLSCPLSACIVADSLEGKVLSIINHVVWL